MKKYFLSLLISFLLIAPKAKADEGMWLLPLLKQLNHTTMSQMGLKLTPEQIYSINSSSLKDAVVIFGNGCTGEIISDDGLLITNHHCGYGAIQSHTTLENDVLGEGFWAKTKADEMPTPGLTVTFLVRTEDVTKEVLSGISDDMSELERLQTIDSIAIKLEKEATEGTHYKASIRSFFERNQYFIFVYETYKDVRLVGTPPESIGKFGHDTDNWMWPRHTGDFSMFRVYTAPDGTPAKYSKDNIPLKPKHHLPISIKGIKEGDFSMIMGYPGGTDRYITSWGVEELMEVTHPNRIKIRGIRQEILNEDMKADKEVYNKYASKYARSSNYWKYSIGQSKGIKRLNVIERKKEQEAVFTTWVEADKERKERYGNVLSSIESHYKNHKNAYSNTQLLNEVFRATEIISLAKQFSGFDAFLTAEKTTQEAIDKKTSELKENAEKFYKDYNKSTDIKVVKALLKTYYEMVPANQRPSFFTSIEGKYKGNFEKYVDNLFEKSMFDDKDKLFAFLSSPSAKVLLKDPAFKIAQSVEKKLTQEMMLSKKDQLAFLKARRLYTEGVMKMNNDKKYYPDANFTMRFTYGKVGGYTPADAVKYNYYTTLKGVMEKEGPKNGEFEVPDKLKELYKSKNYGPYAEKDHMPVCFTTNNDITGGNSGSPVINGKGELIGLAFDGNWEAMSGDIVFENELQKTICVDIRYVLFIIDKYAEAHHLIDEMTLVE